MQAVIGQLAKRAGAQALIVSALASAFLFGLTMERTTAELVEGTAATLALPVLLSAAGHEEGVPSPRYLDDGLAVFETEGLRVVVEPHGDSDLALSVVLDNEESPLDETALNAWNRERRWTRAYLSPDRRFIALQMDVALVRADAIALGAQVRGFLDAVEAFAEWRSAHLNLATRE